MDIRAGAPFRASSVRPVNSTVRGASGRPAPGATRLAKLVHHLFVGHQQSTDLDDLLVLGARMIRVGFQVEDHKPHKGSVWKGWHRRVINGAVGTAGGDGSDETGFVLIGWWLYGRPRAEALAAIVGGVVLGSSALRSRSIWWGVSADTTVQASWVWRLSSTRDSCSKTGRRLSASFGGLRETSYLFGSLPRRWSAESAKCMIESLDLAHTTPAATGEVA